MHVRPKVWSHHHVQRLYHLSMLAAFIFIVAVIIFGFFAVLWQAEALTLSVQNDEAVSATVPGITTATSTPENNPVVLVGGGGHDFPTTTPPNPYVTVKPTQGVLQPEPVKLANQEPLTIYIIGTSQPTFFGQTNVPGALIFVEVFSRGYIRGGVVADSQGNWQWQVPVKLEAGEHTVTVTAKDPGSRKSLASASLVFFVEPSPNAPIQVVNPQPKPAGSYAFNLFLQILPKYQSVYPGQETRAGVEIINFGEKGHPARAILQFSVTDPSGKLILNSSEAVNVTDDTKIIKPFFLNPLADTGKYTLSVSLSKGSTTAYASGSFEVKPLLQAKLSALSGTNFPLVDQILLVLLFFFSMVVYFEYNKVAALSRFIKRVNEGALKSGA